MKISKKDKEKVRGRIIEAAVEIIIEKGFKGATMRDISRKAGIADATIYTYFPAKDAILYSYYHDKMIALTEELKAIKSFHEFTLQEQLQSVVDASLNLYLGDREFVQKTFKTVFFAFPHRLKNIEPIKNAFLKIANELIEAAVEVDEIPPQSFDAMISHLLWDYYIGVVLYWLGDRSEAFVDTSQFVDKSLGIVYSLLQAGLINKLLDLFSYLFKNHVMRYFDAFGQANELKKYVKREFMGRSDEK